MQNIVSKIIMGTAIIVFSIILKSNLALAQNCVSNDCAAMGYTKTAANCVGADTIKCPFDMSKVFCSPEVCIGYNKGTPNCADGQTVTLCKEDSRYFKCSGYACSPGYSTATTSCISGECKIGQNNNYSCNKCINDGGCRGFSVGISDCPVGFKNRCTNACGKAYRECCTGGNNCFMQRPNEL